MKASEICIGDWFKAIDYNSPFRITAIYDDVVQTQANYQSEIDGNWYSEAYIKDLVPIELTEEILVKNGFKKESQTIDGDYCKYTLPGFALNWCDTDGFWYQNGDITPNHVHTLQHLLRLVGVDKEIEL